MEVESEAARGAVRTAVTAVVLVVGARCDQRQAIRPMHSAESVVPKTIESS